jgi:hypothetical protein
MWLPLERRNIAHAKVTGVTDVQPLSVIASCNGSARQITDAVADLALRVCRANALSQNIIAQDARVV